LSEEYELLRQKMKVCMECPLCAARHQVVVDRGTPTARLLLIGESPGATEDATGQAFVGPAGALLDELLAEAGIGSDRFLIINVLRCRPPNNHFPGDSESRFKVEDTVRKCLPWLDQQITLVQPKVIVLVGHKAATWTVFRDKNGSVPSMSEICGRLIRADRYPGTLIFAMYHTSYLLRAQDNLEQAAKIREETVQTLRWAWDAVQGIVPDIPTLHVRSDDKRYEQLKFF
jgi:uracil-DNA glycosylase